MQLVERLKLKSRTQAADKSLQELELSGKHALKEALATFFKQKEQKNFKGIRVATQ